MNNKLLKCLPILALTFGLSACGDKAAEVPGSDNTPPALTAAPTLNTTYQMDCDGGAPVAASDVAVNISACQFNSEQLAVLRQLGPVSVDANCKSRSVKIRNNEGHIVGVSALKEDNTYEAKLDVAARFAKLAGCPADISGTAAGQVTCTEDKKVSNVTISTNYAFAQPETAGAAVSRLTDESQGGQEKGGQEKGGKQEEPAPLPGKDDGKGNQEQPPAPLPGKDDGKGNQEQPGQEKGKKGGGQMDDTPTQPIACVNFAPCAFSSSTSLSCGQ